MSANFPTMESHNLAVAHAARFEQERHRGLFLEAFLDAWRCQVAGGADAWYGRYREALDRGWWVILAGLLEGAAAARREKGWTS